MGPLFLKRDEIFMLKLGQKRGKLSHFDDER
jgi:hypothetical protein